MLLLEIFIASVLLYFIVQRTAPIIVYSVGHRLDIVWHGLYAVKAINKIPVPSYNWREVKTGLRIAPFGTFTIGKHRIHLFGDVRYRVLPQYDVQSRGVSVAPVVGSPDEPWVTLMFTNLNPKYPFVVRPGETLAYIELYRTTRLPVIQILKKDIDNGTESA